MANGGGARVSDAERQKVIELLRHHTGAGRLTLDEFAERVGDVYAALTRDELAQVVADLPEGVRPEVGPAAATATAPSSALSPSVIDRREATNRRRRFVAIMCASEARGPWHAPEKMTALAFWGGVTIDLRNALIESAVVEIRAWSIMGHVEVIVPPGIPVEMHGLVLMGGSTNRVRAEDPIPGAPLVRVLTRGLWGGVTIRNPSRRRSRDRHGHRRGQAHAEVHQLVEDALDVARGAVDRALTTGSVADRIPRSNPRPTANASRVPQDHEAPMSDGNHATPTNQNVNQSTPSPSAAVSSRIPAGTLTILVSDIADSTKMTERYGDQDWIDILQAHNSIVRQRVADHGGTEVKAQGDGFLVVFPSARAAVLAAISVQRAMADYRHDHPEVPIDLRLGLHTGEVVATDDDVFGHNVAVASRIADSADPGEIVVSSLTRDLTASASDLGFDGGTDVQLKGVSQPWRVHRVLWS
jgi:class 3 adenylate cyclase